MSNIRLDSNIQRKTNITSKERLYCPHGGCKYTEGSDRFFPTKFQLNQHYQKVHANKQYKCSKCSKGFGSKTYRKHHEETCGLTWTCMCGMSYNLRETLITHCKRLKHELPPNVLKKPPKDKKIAAKSQPAIVPVVLLVQVNVNPPALASPKITVATQTPEPSYRPAACQTLSPKKMRYTPSTSQMLQTQDSFESIQTQTDSFYRDQESWTSQLDFSPENSNINVGLHSSQFSSFVNNFSSQTSNYSPLSQEEFSIPAPSDSLSLTPNLITGFSTSTLSSLDSNKSDIPQHNSVFKINNDPSFSVFQDLNQKSDMDNLSNSLNAGLYPDLDPLLGLGDTSSMATQTTSSDPWLSTTNGMDNETQTTWFNNIDIQTQTTWDEDLSSYLSMVNVPTLDTETQTHKELAHSSSQTQDLNDLFHLI